MIAVAEEEINFARFRLLFFELLDHYLARIHQLLPQQVKKRQESSG